MAYMSVVDFSSCIRVHRLVEQLDHPTIKAQCCKSNCFDSFLFVLM